MWTLAHGDAIDWLVPNLAGAIAPTGGGPLSYWAGAISIRLLGGLCGEHAAALATNLIWIPLILCSLWIAIFRLARRDEAQPVSGVFGGQASRTAYARLLADIGVLLTIGTLGMTWRFHQTSADNAGLACAALVLLALSLLEWHWLAACALAGVACAGYALAQSPLGGIGLLCGALLAIGASARPLQVSPSTLISGLTAAALAAVVPLAVWLGLANHLAPDALATYLDAWAVSAFSQNVAIKDLLWLARDGTWFFWPLWPLAAWGTYAWRDSFRQAHLVRPGLVLVGLLAGALMAGTFTEGLVAAMLVPLVPMAAFGATCLRRAVDNLIDWLAMAFFSLAQLVLWLYYLAWVTGAPHAMANSMTRLTPGFTEQPRLALLCLAALTSLTWAGLVGWRILRRPRVLWRGPLLAAAGVSAIWLQVNLLYLPGLNYVFSFQPFAHDIAAQLQQQNLGDTCVLTQQVPQSERAVLAISGHVRFARDGRHDDCRVALTHDVHRSSLDDMAPPGQAGSWQLVWETRRRFKPDEHWQLWVKKP
jgi:4-amino-4-deoxy-L-arabinose transferase-like glycosyltransferase